MLSLGEIHAAMTKLNGWSLEDGAIVKGFSFENFKESLNFVNKVGEVAERMEHHPDIVIQFDTVRLSLVTHSENGVTNKDFALAEEIDKL
jgi:4a-hydroxytetrahydrobiopterin dehydratase